MINLTVKTLDSQNHAFSVEDEITIAQFKEKIADTVSIPADTQRLIYCGRVLQDNSKLKDYDVDGKVIHLVQRPPPSSVLRSDLPEPQAQSQRRVGGLEYVGTVRLPVGGFENTVHSLPIHSLANSRLNVAKRMICRAETVLNALENPNRQDQPPPTEPQEEATPVFEARVVIPTAAPFAAPEESFTTSTPIAVDPVPVPPQAIILPEGLEAIIDPLSNGTSNSDPPHSVSSTPEVISPLTRSTENLTTADVESNNVPEESAATASEGENSTSYTTANSSTSTQNPPSGNVSRTGEFADILDSLNRLHTRFMPFMEQYNTFMREDPVVQQENVRSTQAMINRVSEVCHYLGHAYHSVSDIILRVRTPPPRSLLCRPMLIQHSAVVQAQINIPTDRSNSTPSTTSASTNSTGSTPVTASAATSSDLPMNAILGIPFLPRSAVRVVETYRLPLFEGNNMLRNNNNSSAGTFRATNSVPPDAYAAAIRSIESRAQSMLNSTTTTASTTTPGEQPSVQPMDVASAIASSVVNSLTGNATTEIGGGTTGVNVTNENSQGGSNNPNLEFFMEVTPESITIDSLETAFVGSNQGNDLNSLLQEGINPPTTEFIQSIMQMAGQLINRGSVTSNTGVSVAVSSGTSSTTGSTPTPSAPPLEVSASPVSDASVTTSVGAARTTPFQNSQARGNTQTQPTTATHTRSTPRPQVLLAQHTMHAFDPFLPCNSHHVLTRRRYNASAPSQQNATPPNSQSTTNQRGSVDLNDDTSPVYNIIRNLLNSVRTSVPAGYVPNVSGATSATPSSEPNNIGAAQDFMNAAATWMATMPDGNYVDRRPTIARILQQFPDNTYVPGESIFTDLIMLLSRGFTIGDIMQIISGRLEPLSRISSELRTFVLCRILEGDTSDSGYDRAVEKLLAEMQLFHDQLGLLQARDNIDVVRSVQALLRARLPNIIALAISRNPNSTRLMFEQIRTTVQQLGALVVRASETGSDGVQTVFETFLMRFMEGVPSDLQQWSLHTTRPQISTFLTSLEVPESLLQRYIVRNVDPIIPNVAVSESQHSTPEPEPMQVEEVVVESSATAEEVVAPALHITEDNEPLPTVVIGSAPWHAQVPSDWVPIIVRDSQRQRRQGSQPPFSDAYLSGMPSKRRKLAECNKPPGSISQVISESVRRAVTATGLTTVAPLETVSQAAAADLNIRSAYRDLLHNTVQSELENNEDFTPERFPNVDSYFNNRPQ